MQYNSNKHPIHTPVPHAIAHAILATALATCFSILVAPTLSLVQQLEVNGQLAGTEFDVRNGMYNAYYSDTEWSDPSIAQQTFDYSTYKAVKEYQIQVMSQAAATELANLEAVDPYYKPAALAVVAPPTVYPVRVMVATGDDNEVIASYQTPSSNDEISGPNTDIIVFANLTGTNFAEPITTQTAKEAGIIVPHNPEELVWEDEMIADTTVIAEDGTAEVKVLSPKELAIADLVTAENTYKELEVKKVNLEAAMDRYIAVTAPKIRTGQTTYASAEKSYAEIQSMPVSSFGGETQYAMALNGAQIALKAAENSLVIQNGKFGDEIAKYTKAIETTDAALVIAKNAVTTANEVVASFGGIPSNAPITIPVGAISTTSSSISSSSVSSEVSTSVSSTSSSVSSSTSVSTSMPSSSVSSLHQSACPEGQVRSKDGVCVNSTSSEPECCIATVNGPATCPLNPACSTTW